MARATIWWVAAALLVGCDERERLTFPSTGPGGGAEDDVGPVTTISIPSADSVLTEGHPFIVSGQTVDANGVDTVYFDAEGANQSFLPFAGNGEHTVDFGLPLSTGGRGGETIEIRVYGVDLLGNRGEGVTRRLSVE